MTPDPEACPPAPGATPYDRARERWGQVRGEHHRLLRGQGPRAWDMPEPLADEDLRRLAATLMSPAHRPLLRTLLLDLLGDDITDIALAVVQEVFRGQ